MKILIPTYLTEEHAAPIVDTVQAYSPGHDVIASCRQGSASMNRNVCLDHLLIGEAAVMIDDDITGFYPGWVDDLVRGLCIPGVIIVSARLLTPEGRFAQTCSRCYAAEPEEIEVFSSGTSVLPTAAIAFVHLGYRFDENFRGSGWEDNDWCRQYASDPEVRFVQSNRCQLIHLNEMKEQRGANWDHNKAYFLRKWSDHAQHG